MVSRPPFTVEITKGDGRTLSLHCTFVSPAELEQETSQDTEAIGEYYSYLYGSAIRSWPFETYSGRPSM